MLIRVNTIIAIVVAAVAGVVATAAVATVFHVQGCLSRLPPLGQVQRCLLI